MNADAHQQSGLSSDDVTRFERDGYLVIADPCSLELVDAVLDDIEPVFHDETHPARDRNDDGVAFSRYSDRSAIDYYWHRVKNAWVFSEPVRKLALEPKILAIVDDLVGHGRGVMPFQTLNFPVGTEQPVHYDAMAFESDPPGYMCGLWVALEDVTLENGPLVYYPGSHKLPSISQRKIEDVVGEPLVRRDGYPTYEEFVRQRSNQYTAYCERLIEANGLEPAFGTLQKGQALLWAANLMHGGAKMSDPTSTRHSQVSHYFFKGCRAFYTPFRSEDGHDFWTYAHWIRDPVPEYSTKLLHEAIREHVSPGEKILVATRGESELVEFDDIHAEHFPGDGRSFGGAEQSDSQLIELLEQLRGEGASYIVFPRRELTAFPNRFPALQAHLESHYSAIVRDGFVCAIYALHHERRSSGRARF